MPPHFVQTTTFIWILQKETWRQWFKVIPRLVGEGEGRQEKGRFSSQCHCGWWELNPTRELWKNTVGHLTQSYPIWELQELEIFCLLPLVICGGLPARVGCYFWNFSFLRPTEWASNCQREPTGSWKFGHSAVVYKRIQVTSATVAFPPPALSLDLWKLLFEWCIVLLISKPIQYCPTTTKTAVLKCDLPLFKHKYFPNRQSSKDSAPLTTNMNMYVCSEILVE